MGSCAAGIQGHSKIPCLIASCFRELARGPLVCHRNPIMHGGAPTSPSGHKPTNIHITRFHGGSIVEGCIVGFRAPFGACQRGLSPLLQPHPPPPPRRRPPAVCRRVGASCYRSCSAIAVHLCHVHLHIFAALARLTPASRVGARTWHPSCWALRWPVPPPRIVAGCSAVHHTLDSTSRSSQPVPQLIRRPWLGAAVALRCSYSINVSLGLPSRCLSSRRWAAPPQLRSPPRRQTCRAPRSRLVPTRCRSSTLSCRRRCW